MRVPAPSDTADARVGFALHNALLLERYGYWDEARARDSLVVDESPADDDYAQQARTRMIAMAMALGDPAEVARLAAAAPSAR